MTGAEKLPMADVRAVGARQAPQRRAALEDLGVFGRHPVER
jgi:hypothetical protein